MVLLVLGVVSLLGIGLLTQSRLDVRMSSAMRSYAKMFSLADGGATIAFQDLDKFNRDVSFTPELDLSSILSDENAEEREYIRDVNRNAIKNMAIITHVNGKALTDRVSETMSACLMVAGYHGDAPGEDAEDTRLALWIAEGTGKRDHRIFGAQKSSIDGHMDATLFHHAKVEPRSVVHCCVKKPMKVTH